MNLRSWCAIWAVLWVHLFVFVYLVLRILSTLKLKNSAARRLSEVAGVLG